MSFRGRGGGFRGRGGDRGKNKIYFIWKKISYRNSMNNFVWMNPQYVSSNYL